MRRTAFVTLVVSALLASAALLGLAPAAIAQPIQGQSTPIAQVVDGFPILPASVLSEPDATCSGQVSMIQTVDSSKVKSINNTNSPYVQFFKTPSTPNLTNYCFVGSTSSLEIMQDGTSSA